MTDERRMPMFPLQSVLVPAAPLPLHVFEPRYLQLLDDVLGDATREFGVVLIERGSEVGGGDSRSRVGTVARIVDAAQTPERTWGVVAVGTRRIDVVEWLPDDPYPQALVVDRPDPAWTTEAAAELRQTEPVVRRALALKAELGEAAPAATIDLDQVPSTRAWQLLAVAPIAVLDRQRLLRVDEPEHRLYALRRLVEEEVDVLSQRMRGL